MLVKDAHVLLELNPVAGGGWGKGHYRVGRRAWKIPSTNHADIGMATAAIARQTRRRDRIEVLDAASGNVWGIEGEVERD